MTVPDQDRPRWHVVKTRATTPHTFAISPGEWRERRLTLAARDDAADREEQAYARLKKTWLSWLRNAFDAGRVSAAELELAAPEFASVFIAGEELTSELGDAGWAASQFRRRFPTLMSEFVAEALSDKQAYPLIEAWGIIDFAGQFVSGPGGWTERRTSLWRGEWPDDVAIVQVADGKRWGPVTSYGAQHGFHPPLADEWFISALQDGGEVTGWHAAAIDVRDRNWEPVRTHQAVFVDDRIWLGPLARPQDHSDSGFWSYAFVEPESEGDASILRGDHGLYVSQAAADALTAKKPSGFELMPLRYADEVPQSERGFAGP